MEYRIHLPSVPHVLFFSPFHAYLLSSYPPRRNTFSSCPQSQEPRFFGVSYGFSATPPITDPSWFCISRANDYAESMIVLHPSRKDGKGPLTVCPSPLTMGLVYWFFFSILPLTSQTRVASQIHSQQNLQKYYSQPSQICSPVNSFDVCRICEGTHPVTSLIVLSKRTVENHR